MTPPRPLTTARPGDAVPGHEWPGRVARASALRARALALAGRLGRLREGVERAPGGAVADDLVRRIDALERELARLGSAYYEEHCGPHLGRLREQGGRRGE